MNRILTFFLLQACLMLSIPPMTVAREPRHYTCYRTSEAIVIDGLPSEPAWAAAEWSTDFCDITGDPKMTPPLRTRFKMLRDDQTLYVLAELQEPRIWARLRQRDTVIFHDNDFELFIDPDGNGRNYLEIEINPLGTVWDLMLTKPYKDHGRPLTDWNLEGMKAGVHVNGTLNDPSDADSSWTIELALPVGGLMKGKDPARVPLDGVQWRINFSRVEWETETRGSCYVKKCDPATGKPLPENNWSWSPMGEVSMHIPERWGWLEFAGEDIVPAPLPWVSREQKRRFTAWAWTGGYEKLSAPGLDSLFREMKEAGIEGILTGADSATMRRIIPAAAGHGLRVQKWFVALMNNDPDLVRDHPDWFVISREGKSSVTDPAYVGYYRFLCPSNPDVRRYLADGIGEYLAIPGLDGIHLDYIRYPDVILPPALWAKYGIVQDREYAPYDYCYCPLCRERFMKQGGSDPVAMEHPEEDAEWRSFRYDQVTGLVTELAKESHQSGKKISAAVFPGPSTARQLVRQDWGRWPLDEVMPMLYHTFYNGSLDWIRFQTGEGVQSIPKKTPLYSGLYIPALTPRELQTAVRKAVEGGASGISLFTWDAMTPAHRDALKMILAR